MSDFNGKLELNRKKLYKLITDNFSLIEKYLKNPDDKQLLIGLFEDSAIFMGYFEDVLYASNELSFEKFDELINKALNSIKDSHLKDYLYKQISKDTQTDVKSKNKLSYKKIIVSLFRELANYHNKLVKKYFKDVWFDDSSIDFLKRPQTFLSYAYDDRGVTLGLFIYFIINGGFLYVNWMWSGVNPNSIITKKELNKALLNSIQLLFLRTPNSDLNYYGGSSIRQWCSWEIGNYYTINKNCKYYLDFYDSKKRNDLLDSFSVFRYVADGIINKNHST